MAESHKSLFLGLIPELDQVSRGMNCKLQHLPYIGLVRASEHRRGVFGGNLPLFLHDRSIFQNAVVQPCILI